MADRRAAYVARRDAAPDRSVYRRSAPETTPDCVPQAETTSDQPVWPSAQRVSATSQYQRPGPAFASVLRTGIGRLLAIVAIVCPLLVLGWVVLEFFRL